MVSEQAAEKVAAKSAAKSGRRRTKKPSCETCFFGTRELCALELGGPCATYRPATPSGLLPPRQPALLIREPDEPAIAA